MDWLIGWTNWLRSLVYPMPLKRLVCRKRGHREFKIDQNMWCTRCGHNDAEPPRPTVQVGCGLCSVVLEVPFEYTVTEPDEDGHQHLEFDPDMADLWAHSWAHGDSDG